MQQISSNYLDSCKVIHRHCMHMLLTAFAILTLSSCATVGPEYVPPSENVPDQWLQALSEDITAGQLDLVSWWEHLNDSQLSTLIIRAKENNPGLKESIARIREARAIRAIAAGERVPDINAGGGISRNRESDAVILPNSDFNNSDTFYEIGASASWEFDFWGRIKRSIESTDASLQGSLENYRDALVLLYSEVALTYTETRTLQARIQYINVNIATQQAALNLVNERNRAGVSSDLEVNQARLNLYRTMSTLPTLEANLIKSINQLGVLLGEHPQSLHAELTDPAPIPSVPQQILVGVPGDLVRRRPDIRAAERSLAAQSALIGVATAELYPRFTIDGNFSILATQFNDLDDWDNRGFSIGGFFSWNIFDGGRIRGLIEVENARTEQSLYQYEQIVLRALEEVESNLAEFVWEQKRKQALLQSVKAAKKSAELVLILYQTGLTDFQNVLDMQRSLFEQQDRLAGSDGNIVKDLIRIYTALGGGWNPDDLPALN